MNKREIKIKCEGCKKRHYKTEVSLNSKRLIHFCKRNNIFEINIKCRMLFILQNQQIIFKKGNTLNNSVIIIKTIFRYA